VYVTTMWLLMMLADIPVYLVYQTDDTPNRYERQAFIGFCDVCAKSFL